MEPPMTVKELSDYLRLDRMTIYKMLKEGNLPASRIGHQWRFFRDDIDEWIRSLRPGHKKAVLLVNDDPAVCQLIGTELPSDNFDVVVASDGEEALKLTSERQFDLVFLELRSPTIDVFKHIRESNSAVPVVVVAGQPDGRLVDQAMAIGTFTLVKKPTTGADVKRILAAVPLKAGP